MLLGTALDDALSRVITRPESAQYFRATPMTYAYDPLGRGRSIASMRFNVSKGARILYLGETSLVCLSEAQAVGFPAHAMVVVPVEVRLESILDLRDQDTQKTLRLTMSDLLLNFRGLNKKGKVADTQTLGERCHALGIIDGIQYPSAALKGKWSCLAVLENSLQTSKTAIVVRPSSDPNGKPIRPPIPPGCSGPPIGLPPDIWDQLP